MIDNSDPVEAVQFYTFWLSGPIVPKGRPRFAAGRVFTPKRTKTFEEYVGWRAKQHGVRRMTGPLMVTINAFIEMPKSWSQKKRDTMHGTPAHESPIDTDNIGKSTADGLNGIAYEDDRQITTFTITKKWGRIGGAWVTIRQLTEREKEGERD